MSPLPAEKELIAELETVIDGSGMGDLAGLDVKKLGSESLAVLDDEQTETVDKEKGTGEAWHLSRRRSLRMRVRWG